MDIERTSEVESIEPTSKQAQAFAAPERFVLYGGAMGGGKSTWLCAYGIELSIRYDGNVGYLCRHELRSFRRSTMQTLQDHMPWALVAQHHKTENYIRFKNNSVIYYGGLGDDRRAIERLKSMELGWFGIDQAEETTEKFFFMLSSRLRLRTEKGLRYKGIMTANPEPNWIKVRFVDQQLRNHAFIPALPRDNPYLPDDYEENIRQMNLPEELVRAWLEGDWNALTSVKLIFPMNWVVDAMNRKVEHRPDDEEEYGMDVAEFGGDETVLVRKRGMRFEFVGIWPLQDPMESTGECIRAVNYDKRKKIKVDAIGPGNGVYFRLKELGFNVYPIKGSERPSEKFSERYKNKKTEHFFNFRAMLPYCQLPADTTTRTQMNSIRYRTMSNGLIAVETKQELRRRGLPSPDRMEALIYAAASTDEADEIGEVFYAGMGEKPKEKKKRPMTPEEEDRQEIAEEVARMTRNYPGRRRKKEEEELDDDEGKVFISDI